MLPASGGAIAPSPTRRVRGCRRNDWMRVTVSFEELQFHEIMAQARRTGQTFAETVRTLCEVGLEEFREEV